MPHVREHGDIVEGHQCRACRSAPARRPLDEWCAGGGDAGFVARFVTYAACVTWVLSTGHGRLGCSSCHGSGIRDFQVSVPPIITDRTPFG